METVSWLIDGRGREYYVESEYFTYGERAAMRDEIDNNIADEKSNVALLSGVAGGAAAVCADEIVKHTPAAPLAGWIAATVGGVVAYALDQGGVWENMHHYIGDGSSYISAAFSQLPLPDVSAVGFQNDDGFASYNSDSTASFSDGGSVCAATFDYDTGAASPTEDLK